MYSKKGAAWVNETGKKEVTKQTVAYSPRSKLGTLLPEFPNVKDLNLPSNIPEEKVAIEPDLFPRVSPLCSSKSHTRQCPTSSHLSKKNTLSKTM